MEYHDGVTEHCDEATVWRKGKAEGQKDRISGEESQTELKNNHWAIIVKNCIMRQSDRVVWRKDSGKDREMVGMTRMQRGFKKGQKGWRMRMEWMEWQ